MKRRNLLIVDLTRVENQIRETKIMHAGDSDEALWQYFLNVAHLKF